LLAIKIDKYIIFDIKSFNNLAKYLPPLKIRLDSSLKDPDTANLPNKQYKQWNSGENIIRGGDLVELLASNNNGSNEQLSRQGDVLKNLVENIFNISLIFNIPQIVKEFNEGSFYTDFNKTEILSLLISMSQLKENDFKVGYTKSTAYYKVPYVSYYPVFAVDYSKLDQDVLNIFSDMNIFKEQARIELLNSSSVIGLAANRGRWISNTGARIIKIGNSFENEPTTKIYCENPSKFEYTIKELQRIFSYKAQLITKDYPNRHVGDIIVVIGEDY
jgi:hypothetical protein